MKVCVNAIVKERSRAEIDQIELTRSNVDEKILVFDITMENLKNETLDNEDLGQGDRTYAALVNILQNLDNLFEEIAC